MSREPEYDDETIEAAIFWLEILGQNMGRFGWWLVPYDILDPNEEDGVRQLVYDAGDSVGAFSLTGNYRRALEAAAMLREGWLPLHHEGL